MTKYVAGGDQRVRVRMSPSLNAPVVFCIPTGQTVDVDIIVDGWAKVNFGFSGPQMIQDNENNLPPGFYMFAALLTPVAPPVVVPPKVYRNGLGIHFLASHALAPAALKAGCRDYIFMDDWDGARWAADALGKTNAIDGKGTVMFRYWWNHWPSYEECCARLHLGEDKRIISIVTNESEHLGRDDMVKAIHDHAELDIRVATEAARLGTHVAVGTFAVGNPDITNPAICKALYDYYAPFWNTFYAKTGVRPLWDQHEYSPDETHIYNTWEGAVNVSDRKIYIYEQDWHETRVKFLFELCGFNLESGGLLVSSETGIDKNGKGGYIGCGIDGQGALKWAERWFEIWKRPVHDEFGHYEAMPKEAACLYQGTDAANGTGHWGSYFVGNMLGDLSPAFNHQGVTL